MFAPPVQNQRTRRDRPTRESAASTPLSNELGVVTSESVGGGLVSLLSLKNIIAAIIVVLAMIIIFTGLLRMKRQTLDWQTTNFSTLATPLESAAAAAAAALSAGEGGAVPPRGSAARPPLTIARPYSEAHPGNYYGTFNITSNRSVVISATLGDYFELVVYKYPEWEVAVAMTNPPQEIPLDFLEPGTYAVFVFAADELNSSAVSITNSYNLKRAAPKPGTHRSISSETASFRAKAAASAVASLVPRGSRELLKISSSPAFLWPKPVYTRVETVFAVVPSATGSIYASLPSYGFVTEGADEHLGPLLHEGNGTAIYRIVAKPMSEIEILASNDTETMAVLLTVVYPDLDPESQLSPKTTVYIYT